MPHLDDHSPAPVRPALRPALLALAAFGLASGVGLRQLAGSNRPHELTAAPYVALLLAASFGLAVLALRRLAAIRSDRARRPWTVRHGLLVAALLALAATSLYGFVVAADTTVEVLRAD